MRGCVSGQEVPDFGVEAAAVGAGGDGVERRGGGWGRGSRRSDHGHARAAHVAAHVGAAKLDGERRGWCRRDECDAGGIPQSIGVRERWGLSLSTQWRCTFAIPPSEYTGTPQFFRQDHNYRFAESKFFPDRPTRGRTQTSSTLNSLDVYLRGSMLKKAHNAWLKYMKDGISDDFSDEGFFESGPSDGMGGENEGNMSSAFSVTTSTSNYSISTLRTRCSTTSRLTGAPSRHPTRRATLLQRALARIGKARAPTFADAARNTPAPALTDAHAGGHSPRAQPLYPLNAQPPQVCAQIGQIQKAGTTRLGLDQRQRKGRVRFITLVVVVSLPHIASDTFRKALRSISEQRPMYLRRPREGIAVIQSPREFGELGVGAAFSFIAFLS
ncbi:hypothetical protein C8F04DRAFT_1196787 [Mycena alexandri]|uniref:Uncharacterized protein n=1 Tax=Mycena alexandri TaxID=1745969 RepID=A0AAD6S3S6_9AGAR|nr:hypothetical protein C8F04DRAFT_1196787 [Mycena alexandri]